jgi:hypothetical protein
MGALRIGNARTAQVGELIAESFDRRRSGEWHAVSSLALAGQSRTTKMPFDTAPVQLTELIWDLETRTNADLNSQMSSPTYGLPLRQNARRGEPQRSLTAKRMLRLMTAPLTGFQR